MSDFSSPPWNFMEAHGLLFFFFFQLFPPLIRLCIEAHWGEERGWPGRSERAAHMCSAMQAPGLWAKRKGQGWGRNYVHRRKCVIFILLFVIYDADALQGHANFFVHLGQSYNRHSMEVSGCWTLSSPWSLSITVINQLLARYDLQKNSAGWKVPCRSGVDLILRVRGSKRGSSLIYLGNCLRDFSCKSGVSGSNKSLGNESIEGFCIPFIGS